MQLANEFAAVLVERVDTGNGVRLRIASPRAGTEVLLDPLVLESLTWQPSDVFSRFLEHPHGPDADV